MKPRMVADDERREVARRLRSFVTDDSVYADVDAGRVLHSIGLYYKDIDRIYFSGIDVARLADLIEPSGHECVPGECPLNVRHDNDRIDREALLALADEINRKSNDGTVNPDPMRPLATSLDLFGYARRIREACGEGAE